MEVKNRKTNMTTIFIKNVPRHIKAHFKAHCAKRERNMSEEIIDFMRRAATGSKAEVR